MAAVHLLVVLALLTASVSAAAAERNGVAFKCDGTAFFWFYPMLFVLLQQAKMTWNLLHCMHSRARQPDPSDGTSFVRRLSNFLHVLLMQHELDWVADLLAPLLQIRTLFSVI